MVQLLNPDPLSYRSHQNIEHVWISKMRMMI